MVSKTTAIRLKEIGFPQPEYQAGQYWYVLGQEDQPVLFSGYSVVRGERLRTVGTHNAAYQWHFRCVENYEKMVYAAPLEALMRDCAALLRKYRCEIPSSILDIISSSANMEEIFALEVLRIIEREQHAPQNHREAIWVR